MFFSTVHYGWANLYADDGTFISNPSYIGTPHLDLVDAIGECVRTSESVCVFDEEGNWVTLVLRRDGYTIDNGSGARETRLWHNGLASEARTLLEGIASARDEWVQWEFPETPEEVSEAESHIDDALADLARYIRVLEAGE